MKHRGIFFCLLILCIFSSTQCSTLKQANTLAGGIQTTGTIPGQTSSESGAQEKRYATEGQNPAVAAAGQKLQAPVIGVSTGYSRGKISVGEDYCVAVRKAGGTPVVLPLVRNIDEARELISLVDGLLMTGGEDVAPEYYDESPVNETVYVNGPRDTSDFLLLEAAKERALPLMGICRGEQIINVFYGGSLVQDIPSQVETEVCHSQKEAKATGTHWIYLKEGTRIREMIGADSLLVNTFHHQAVKSIAPPFTISATASDGVVEAYEGTINAEVTESKAYKKTVTGAEEGGLGTEQRVICVQFHPEGFVYAGDDTFLPLFQEFVNNARERRGK